jgi:hypothetical protein
MNRPTCGTIDIGDCPAVEENRRVQSNSTRPAHGASAVRSIRASSEERYGFGNSSTPASSRP